MKRSAAILTAALLLIQCLHGFAQGFINLNFESAVINTNITPPPPYPPFNLVASNGIPGWTAYYNGTAYPYIIYNNFTLGSEMIGLEGTNNSRGYPSIQGKYFVAVSGSSEGLFPHSGAIGQTAMIPLSAMSLIFQGGVFGPATVTFGGQVLPLTVIGTIPNYSIYAADISGYAGQTGELLFTALGGSALNPSSIGGFMLDNIQFSTTPIPEPSTLALTALGILLLCGRRWKSSGSELR